MNYRKFPSGERIYEAARKNAHFRVISTEGALYFSGQFPTHHKFFSAHNCLMNNNRESKNPAIAASCIMIISWGEISRDPNSR